MTNDNALLIISACGIVAIVVILAALLILRVLRFSIFGLANLVLKSVIDPGEAPSRLDARPQSVARPRSRNLRAEAQSVDFDAAVAQHKGEASPSVRTTPAAANLGAVSAQAEPEPLPDDSRSLRSRRRRMPEEDNEGLLGGFMDDDDGAGLLG